MERESEAVDISVSTLPVGPPQVPDEPSVTDITDSSATVSWTDPGLCVCECSIHCCGVPVTY